MKPKRESLPTDIHRWSWSHRAILPDGMKLALRGHVEAPRDRMGETASSIVDREMREKYPTARWMHGRSIEGEGVYENCKFGPTVQRGKFLRPGPEPQPTNTDGERNQDPADAP